MQQIVNITKMVTGIIILAASLLFSCFAQTLPGIQNEFNKYAENNLQEKLFVHTDREAYLTGEIIWFKIYDVDGTYNKPLNFSKVAYVDVLDNQQNPVMQAKIILDNASGNGSFFIPLSVANGSYKLRAYTSWMKNFSPEYYFEKAITIVNPQIVPVVDSKIAGNNYDIQFFPEGGSLVNGIKSKVAFKAIDRDGMGIDFKGAIINQRKDTIVKFAPLKFGMGNFMFTPVKGDTYTAIATTANNVSINKPLPTIADNGYVMQLTGNGSGQIDISVSSNVDVSGTVYILAHTRQVIKVAKQASLENGVAHFLVNKNLLDDGISHITIFNGNRQPVCERLVFKRPEQKIFIDAHSAEKQYAGRSKVNVPVQVKNKLGVAVKADLSMAVYRLDEFQTKYTGDILSYLWLNSDLQGNVESPGYYFSDDTQAAAAADNLMLTQGWRRFDWKHVLADKPAAFSFVPEIYGHLVNGKIVNNITNQPAAGIVAYLGVPGKKVQLFVSKSDSLGRLLFNTRNLYGDEIIVQTNSQIDSTYRIDILKPFSEQYSKTPFPLFNVNSRLREALEKQNIGMQVQNIYSGNKTRQFFEPGTNSAGFYRKPINTYQLDDYTRFTTMEEVLREYVKEVNIFRQQSKFHIKVIGPQGFLEGDPLVLMDGIPVFDINKVMAADPLAIKKLEVVPETYYYGPATQQGILSYTSYKGNLGGVDIDPHAVVVDYEGMQLQRVFYSPVYETIEQLKSRVPDFRNLLFWSPSVTANGNNPVSFYTSDQEGKFIGIVQGITANGDAASSYFTFEVKK